MAAPQMSDPLPEDPLQDLQDHLLTAPPEAWLDVMRRAKPDQHYDLISWMIAQPECDATIAMVAFYRCGAADCLRRAISIVPDDPARDAIPVIVAEAFGAGQYNAFSLGLSPGELDDDMDNMARLLADTPVEDRIYDVPMSFLVAPRAGERELDPIWSPKFDAETAQLYRAAGLQMVTPGAAEPDDQEAEASTGGLGGLVARLTGMIRRPEATPAE